MADGSPVIAVKSEDDAVQENGANKASQQARVLVVAQHVSLLPAWDTLITRMRVAGNSTCSPRHLFCVRLQWCIWHEMG